MKIEKLSEIAGTDADMETRAREIEQKQLQLISLDDERDDALL